MFGSQEATNISLIYVSKNELPDKIVQHFEKNRHYTVKSQYKLLTSPTNLVDEQNKAVWRCLWDTPAPKKIQVLMWRVVRGILLVRANLNRFNIPVERACKRCDNGEESISHAIFNCYKAQRCGDCKDDIGALWILVSY